MKIGDNVYVHGYVDEIRNDTVIIRNKGGFFGTVRSEIICGEMRTGHWIPCSERLPEDEVLCCDIRGEMILGYPYQDDESSTGYSAVLDDVYMVDCIAWMEKPEPYKGESEE